MTDEAVRERAEQLARENWEELLRTVPEARTELCEWDDEHPATREAGVLRMIPIARRILALEEALTRALELYGGSTWGDERAWEAQARKALGE